MRIERKLRQWRDAGILDGEAADRIRTFESDRKNPMLLYALAWLGTATIGIGTVSVVAANWRGIEDHHKLLAMGLLGIALAASIARAQTLDRRVWSEALVCLDYLFVLASIGLIGQIYQSGTPAWQALLFWSAITLPLLLLARTMLGGGLWFVGSMVTYAFVSVEWVERLRSESWLDASTAAAFVYPTVMIGAASLPWLRARRPAVASAFASGSAALLVVAGVVSPFVFYSRIHASDLLSWSIAVLALLFLGVHALLPRVLPDASARARLGASLSLACIWLTLATGATFVRDDHEIAGACFQLLFLAVLAWTSVQLGRVTTFNALTALIALRVLVVYFEVFGSMLSTGLGMITGGTLTLIMAWVWKKRSPRLAHRLAAQGGAGHVA